MIWKGRRHHDDPPLSLTRGPPNLLILLIIKKSWFSEVRPLEPTASHKTSVFSPLLDKLTFTHT
jgi:hypothetical protein